MDHYYQQIQALTQQVGALQRSLNNTQQDLHRTNTAVRKELDHNKLILVSVIEYLRSHQNMSLDTFDEIVDQVDKLDGTLDGKTTAALNYGSLQQQLAEVESSIDPRVAKLLFAGKENYLVKKLAIGTENSVDQSEDENKEV